MSWDYKRIMLEISLDQEAIQQAFKQLIEVGNDLAPAMREIAGVLADATEDAFANEADPVTGNPWPALSDNYLAQNPDRASGQMLQMTAAGLASSIQSENTNDSASVGTNKLYAALHQFGGLPDMAPGPAAVPARPYLGMSTEDETEMLAIIGRHLIK